MRYEVISGPWCETDDNSKIITFSEAITIMMKHGWVPQGGIAIMHLTGASALAAGGEDVVFHGMHYYAQAMVHNDDDAEIPGNIAQWL